LKPNEKPPVADAQLRAVITAEDKASKVIADVGGSLDKVQSKLQSMQPTFKSMAVAGGIAFGAIAAIGVKAVKDYADSEKASKQLEHAVIDVTHATREQLKATEDLAGALARKGVLDDDVIKMGLAQLSTFGLSNDAVRKLGGSLADLAVNQFGVNASGEQLADTANMIAKALNGQFGILEKSGIRFTEAQKSVIEFGTEEQKVAAINEGFAQNLKYTNEVALTTFEGKMAHVKVQLGEVSENIGKALIPALESLLAKVLPVIERFVAWSAEHPKLVAGILAAAAGIAGLVLVLGTVGLLLPGIITAVTLLGTVFAFIAANPVVLLVAALALMALKVKAAMDEVGGAKEFFRQTWDGIKIIFNDAINSIIGYFQPLINKINQVKSALASIGSSIGGAGRSIGGAISGIFGRASGGLVAPNRSFIVGENGPELFTPSSYGAISNGGAAIVINLTGNTFMGREGIAEQIGKEIMKAIMRNAQV
jgi:hypothetical protein